MNLIELQEKRSVLVGEKNDFLDKASGIRDKAKEEKRGLKAEEQKDADDAIENAQKRSDEIKAIDKQIATAQKEERMHAERAAEAAKQAESAAHGAEAGKEGETREKHEILKKLDTDSIFNFILEKRTLEGSAKELHEEGRSEMRASQLSPSGFAWPSWSVPVLNRTDYEKRTDIDQATSAIAGTVVGGYVRALRETPIFNQVGARVLNGLTSNYLIPIVTKQSLAWKGENATAVDGGQNFGKDTLAPIRLTGFVDVSDQLIIQNGQGVMSEVMYDLGVETGNKIDTALFSSSDVSSAPPSIAGTSNVGTFTETASFADTTSVPKDLALAMQTLADAEGLQGNLGFVLSTKLMNQVMRAAQVSSIIPLASGWNNAFTNVLGHKCWFSINPDSATTGADGLFGNFNKLYIGFFGGMDMMIDPYSVNLTAQKRIVVHRYLDSSLIQGASFVKFSSLFA